MSSYHAVVPVSWSRLTEAVVPGWVETLLARRTVASFAEEFAPNEAELVTAVWQEVDRKSRLPAGWPVPRYLEDVGWAPGALFVAADHLRASALHGELDRSGLTEVGTLAVCYAILFSASVDIARLEAALDLDQQHELFPLFADRVRRSADQGLGLVTLHDAL